MAEGSTSVRVAAENPLGATRSGWDEWISYEAIVNHAFAHRPANILCVYDTNTTPDTVIDAVWRTHPHVAADVDASGAHYHAPADVVATFGRAPPRELLLRSLPLTRDATEFRGLLSAELSAAAAPKAKVVNMLVAASEVLDNAVMHADGPTALRAGLVDGWFVCEIEDRGPGLDDPFAGYVPPETGESPGGAGCGFRQLVSRLELIPGEPGLIVRLWL